MRDFKINAAMAVPREPPAISADVASGASRLLRNMGFSPLAEFPLGNGRRAETLRFARTAANRLAGRGQSASPDFPLSSASP